MYKLRFSGTEGELEQVSKDMLTAQAHEYLLTILHRSYPLTLRQHPLQKEFQQQTFTVKNSITAIPHTECNSTTSTSISKENEPPTTILQVNEIGITTS